MDTGSYAVGDSLPLKEGLKVVLDMDGVLFNLTGPWLDWYNEKWDDHLTIDDITEWDIGKFVKPDANPAIYDFLFQPGMFENLLPMHGAVEAVAEAARRGVQMVALTTCTTPTGAYEKMRAIDKHFPAIGYRNTLITGGHKRWVAGDLLVDDGPHNLESFSGYTCKMRYRFNEKVPTDFAMSGWDDFLPVLEQLEELLKGPSLTVVTSHR